MAVGLRVCAPSRDGERVDSGGAGRATTIPWRPNRRFMPTIPQRTDCKRERHGHADVSQIQERRMHTQQDVILQQRVGCRTVERRRTHQMPRIGRTDQQDVSWL